jgi:hypothetical protein
VIDRRQKHAATCTRVVPRIAVRPHRIVYIAHDKVSERFGAASRALANARSWLVVRPNARLRRTQRRGFVARESPALATPGRAAQSTPLR